MAKVTYYVVQAFVRGKGGKIAAAQPQQVQSADIARRKVERIGGAVLGAVAFSRSGDPAMGDWDGAVIIARAGEIPEDALEAMAAG